MQLEIFMALAGLLLLMCVCANRISSKLGIPSLLVFLAVGMIAGSDGAGIEFYSAELSNYIGSFALSFILFSGGLETNWSSIKNVLVRGTVLATFGVALTAFFMFLLAYYVLGMPFAIALLLSVILSSTDAPAVFSILRTSGLYLNNPRLKSVLEYESGSNDPMAVILSVGAISFLTATSEFSMSGLFLKLIAQMGLGIVMGYGFGLLVLGCLKRFSFIYQGLYPVFGVGIVCLIFSLTQLLGGSGYLAIYIAGIVLGNTSYPYKNPFIQFQSALSWVMQILMFLTLGLFVNPKELSDLFGTALSTTVCLVMIARPLAVFICLFKSEFTRSEKIFISWAGLKGAVPIILATYPLIYDIADARYLFNVIFFLVIVSVLVQGQTLPSLARSLDLSHDRPTADELREIGEPIAMPTGSREPEMFVSFKSSFFRLIIKTLKFFLSLVDWQIYAPDENLPAISGMWNKVKYRTYMLLKKLQAYCLEKDLDEAAKKAKSDLEVRQNEMKQQKKQIFVGVRHMDD